MIMSSAPEKGPMTGLGRTGRKENDGTEEGSWNPPGTCPGALSAWRVGRARPRLGGLHRRRLQGGGGRPAAYELPRRGAHLGRAHQGLPLLRHRQPRRPPLLLHGVEGTLSLRGRDLESRRRVRRLGAPPPRMHEHPVPHVLQPAAQPSREPRLHQRLERGELQGRLAHERIRCRSAEAERLVRKRIRGDIHSFL